MVDEQIKLQNRKYNIQEVANILGIYKGTIKNYEEKGIKMIAQIKDGLHRSGRALCILNN